MTISTRDLLINALGNNASRVPIDKASLSNTVAGQLFSLWRATGVPGQGAIPTTAAVCTSALAGAMGFVNQTALATSYLLHGVLGAANASTTVEIYDRLAHMGGLSGAVITAQGALTLVGVAADRIGHTSYRELMWTLDIYANLGATDVTATVNVTYNDDSTGNLAAITMGTTPRAGRGYPLIPAVAGRYIKAINSVTLSATTGAAGNFGLACRKLLATIVTDTPFRQVVLDWAGLRMENVPNDACLEMMLWCSTTTTGVIRGALKIGHG